MEFVWDWPTRLSHWLFAILVGVSWFTAEQGLMDWHRLSGLTLLGVLTFRIFWGFAGPATARFASFVKGPRSIATYAGSLFSGAHRLTFGHNPLGALSVVAILVALAAQVGLGLFSVDTDGLESGPLARFVSYETAEAAADLHDVTFNIVLALIVLHLMAVMFYLVVKRANLIAPMITGRRTLDARTDPAPRPMAPAPVTRILLGIALGALAVWLVTR